MSRALGEGPGERVSKSRSSTLGQHSFCWGDVPIRQSSPDDSWIKDILKMAKIDSEIQKHRWTGPARKPWHS